MAHQPSNTSHELECKADLTLKGSYLVVSLDDHARGQSEAKVYDLLIPSGRTWGMYAVTASALSEVRLLLGSMNSLAPAKPVNSARRPLICYCMATQQQLSVLIGCCSCIFELSELFVYGTAHPGTELAGYFYSLEVMAWYGRLVLAVASRNL